MVIIFLKYIQKFLNENIGVVTFIVGFLAIYLYVKQKKDRKREAASLILQEIRYAEQLLRNYSSHNNYELSDILLPTNSWNDNIHLFLKDLEESEIDLISHFYSKAAYCDVLISKISDFKNSPLKPMTFPLPTSKPVDGTSFIQDVNASRPIELPPLDPMGPTQNILRSISKSIEFIFNTPAGEKLKKISRRRWYQIF